MFILALNDITKNTLSYLTNNNILVAKLSKECIFTYYTANSLYTKLSKTTHPGIKMINIIDFLPQLEHHIEALIKKQFP